MKEPKCSCKEHDPYCCQVHGSCPTCVKQEQDKKIIINLKNRMIKFVLSIYQSI
jgi:hypothetical protein